MGDVMQQYREQRTDDQMRQLRDAERRILASEFWRGKPTGAEAAVRRLYFTGVGDCGGLVWYSDAQHETDRRHLVEDIEKQFSAQWKRDPERARLIDWRRLISPGDRTE
jgi:hypothetical protein